jgi:hypothetical protein
MEGSSVPMKKVASGIWLYGGIVPYKIEIYAIPVFFAGCRYDDDDRLDENIPAPETADGHVYRLSMGHECNSLAEAMEWANAQPWGPVKWDAKTQ